jgi:hypothetical protein
MMFEWEWWQMMLLRKAAMMLPMDARLMIALVFDSFFPPSLLVCFLGPHRSFG